VEKNIRIWDIPTGRLLRTVESFGCDYWLAFAPDGRMLLSSDTEEVFLSDVQTGKRKHTFTSSLPPGVKRENVLIEILN
jgi:WD40 repeat protein